MSMAITDPARGAAALEAVLRDHRRICVLTGAGVSVDSGIPDFRSPGGVWTRIDPATLSRPAIEGIGVDRAPFWKAMAAIAEAIGTPRPNPIHHAVAALEASGRVIGVATQNIDGLHQSAGSKAVAELHGGHRACRCLGCDARWSTDEILSRVRQGDATPDCEHCGGVIRPDLVLFGDMLDPKVFDRARGWATGCDLCLVLGSSLEVHPAAGLPTLAARSGAKVVIATIGRTSWRGSAVLTVDAALGSTLVPAVERVVGRG